MKPPSTEVGIAVQCVNGEIHMHLAQDSVGFTRGPKKKTIVMSKDDAIALALELERVAKLGC